jgi:aspartyl aminopeptidase
MSVIHNDEKAFLLFVKNELGIDGLVLFKEKKNGNIKEKKLDENDKVESVPCE